jgi:hypothetical protein
MSSLTYETHLKTVGLTRVIVHKITPYCPTMNLIVGADQNESPGKSCYQHFRPEKATGIEEEGFVPIYQLNASPPVRYCFFDDTTCFRILRQGMFFKTKRSEITSLKELISVSDRIPNDDNELAALTVAIKTLTGDSGNGIEKYLYDFKVNFDVANYHSFHVTEFVFKNKENFEDAFINIKDTEDVKDLQDLALYCLARNYRIDKNEPYKDFIASINKEALGVYFVPGGGLSKLKNLLQSNRVFISMGRRGAVIAYADNHGHPQARTSALIMIDILRGRMHNLIVTQTLIDNAIRNLAKLALMSQNENEVEKVRKEVLTNMMEAHKIYGLVVSDPGVYLLDGSVLSRMSELADKYFHLRALKESVEHKMNAMQRFWSEYQDQMRESIIADFVKGETKNNDQQ